jgi:putative glutathione S-transferase
MGRLQKGIWQAAPLAGRTRDGRFNRQDSVFRNWITRDGGPGPTGVGGFPAESGRYHLYVSFACPWAHRTLIFRALKGLDPHVSVDVVHPLLGAEGWTFDTDFPGATGDTVLGKQYLREIYLTADPEATTKVTVPVLWDKATGTIVSNESADIIRMFNSAFDGITGNSLDFYPEPLRPEIDGINGTVYASVNNGVYRAGFARTQEAYSEAAIDLFDTLDRLDARLADSRYLVGDRLTEADWRLATTLFRFDEVYNCHFKCNKHRLTDYANLWPYARELFQVPGVPGTVHIDHIIQHYYRSHTSINPSGIVPIGPDVNWLEPHGRDRRAAA